ncbi:MAG TPA: hypothetical protein VIL36_15335 [Acidimicrobiales bacterium]
MNRQLHLLPHHPRPHRISEETKAVGRRGIAQARAALQAARTGRELPPEELARPAASHSSSRMRAQQRKTAA